MYSRFRLRSKFRAALVNVRVGREKRVGGRCQRATRRSSIGWLVFYCSLNTHARTTVSACYLSAILCQPVGRSSSSIVFYSVYSHESSGPNAVSSVRITKVKPCTLTWDLTRGRCRGAADRPTLPPTTAPRRRPVLLLLLGPLLAVWPLNYASSPLEWNVRMGPPLGSWGGACLDEGMSTAWPRLEAREIHLVWRHHGMRETGDICSRLTFRAKYHKAGVWAGSFLGDGKLLDCGRYNRGHSR